MLDTQNCLQNRIKNTKTTKFLSQLTFHTSKGRTCKVLPFHEFWLSFIVLLYVRYALPDGRHFTHILNTKIGNRNLNTKNARDYKATRYQELENQTKSNKSLKLILVEITCLGFVTRDIKSLNRF